MRALRVIVFNSDESFGPTLRNALSAFDGLRIVAEVDDPAMLVPIVEKFPAELLVVHLDPTPEALLPIAAEVASTNPQLALCAVSESTDGKLILSAMRQGFREFITKPIDEDLLQEALSKIAQECAPQQATGKLISVLGTSGGVGTTSLATNLAVELAAMTSGNVVVVDLDYRFGQVATLLDVSPTYTIADLAQTTEQLEQNVIERTLVKHATGVYVLSRPTHFVQSENITASDCVGVLTALVGMNDYVVVDGPNRYDVGASAILDLADITLLLVQMLVPSVRNAQRILDGMQEAGFSLDRTMLVCNRTGKEAGSLVAADVEATLGQKIFASIPDEWATVSSAVNLGEPLMTRAPKSKVRLAIQELAQRLHDPDGQSVEKDVNKKSGTLLSKIFSEAKS